MNGVEAESLKRIYKARTGIIKRRTKEVPAVDDVTFAIKDGELFGLLGPNGAGKGAG